MITDAVRIVADWLADGTYGVAAQLSGGGVPRDVDVTAVTMPTIVDETREPEIARKVTPDALPVLIVSSAETPVDQRTPVVMPAPFDGEVDVQIRFVTRKGATDQALNDAAQLQRATVKSLNQLFKTAAGNTARVRNQMQLISLRAVRSEWFQSNTDIVVVGAMVLTLQMRDVWATS